MPSKIVRHSARSARGEISACFTFASIHAVIDNNLLLIYRHVKALEQRSQLLDAALAGADEANRRWEECRAIVDQLRIENTALRTALQQAQTQISALGGNPNGSVTSKPDDAQKGSEENATGVSDAPKEATAVV